GRGCDWWSGQWGRVAVPCHRPLDRVRRGRSWRRILTPGPDHVRLAASDSSGLRASPETFPGKVRSGVSQVAENNSEGLAGRWTRTLLAGLEALECGAERLVFVTRLWDLHDRRHAVRHRVRENLAFGLVHGCRLIAIPAGEHTLVELRHRVDLRRN